MGSGLGACPGFGFRISGLELERAYHSGFRGLGLRIEGVILRGVPSAPYLMEGLGGLRTLNPKHVTMLIKELAHKKTCFAFWFMELGVAIMNKGVGVGPGSAARSTSRTSRRESIQIWTASTGQY